MNILMIAENDPAGMGIAFSNLINRYSEHHSRLITFTTRYTCNFEQDIFLQDEYRIEEIEHLLKNADILHFHLLIDENAEIGPLRVADYTKGKKIVYHNHGHPEYLKRYREFNALWKGKPILVATPDLLQLAENATWMPNPVPTNDVQFLPLYDELLPKSPVKVAHAPTRKWHKHTEEFLRVTDRLKGEFGDAFDRVIIENSPYFQCLKIKRHCHMSFDHMNGWFGIASLESLSQGKPTIAGLDEWNTRCIREAFDCKELPWVVARNEDELYTRMRELHLDPALRSRIGHASRQFMEERWSEQAILKKIMDFYSTI